MKLGQWTKQPDGTYTMPAILETEAEVRAAVELGMIIEPVPKRRVGVIVFPPEPKDGHCEGAD